MMMMILDRQLLFTFLLCHRFLCSWAYVSVAVTRSTTTATSTSRSSSSSALRVAVSLDYHDTTKPRGDEVSYRLLLAEAREVAFSESSSAADARCFLNRILELESGCVSGLLAGRDLCEDNVSEVAEVVAHLRRRAEAGDNNPFPTAIMDANAAVTLSLFPVSLFALLLGLVVASTIDWSTGTVPFTVDEWILATRGGYLHTMIDHYIRNGGL